MKDELGREFPVHVTWARLIVLTIIFLAVALVCTAYLANRMAVVTGNQGHILLLLTEINSSSLERDTDLTTRLTTLEQRLSAVNDVQVKNTETIELLRVLLDAQTAKQAADQGAQRKKNATTDRELKEKK